MALVTIQRSPSSSSSPSQDETSGFHDNLDTNRNSKSLSECYFAGKGTALVLPDADATVQLQDGAEGATAKPENGQGTAKGGTSIGKASSAIQRHLQSMFYLLRTEETLKMAVKLESVHATRTRYLVVVSRTGSRGEESCLLGIDCNDQTTVGLVLKIFGDMKITLDGDGGFSVSVCDRHHIFKPVSVQAMWSALQTLHKVSDKAREGNYFQGGGTHSWVEHFESYVTSDQSCLNEWHAMDCLESRRPPSPDSIRARPTEKVETEKVMRSTLKEIMMSVDLDETTSKAIRSRLEEQLDMDLGEYKSFIDSEILVILGQMDSPTEIFDHVYLGSEWNASNYEELQKNGVGHILNVTREIDNFFPGTFKYLNIRVYDDEKTDLLKHFDDTYKFILKAKNDSSKVLVHCKMGVSRSASVVIAYLMKANSWSFRKALEYVRDKRNCIKPNCHFIAQLETYQGMLDAMKNKEKLQRSKSENNLDTPINCNKREKMPSGGEPAPVNPLFSKSDKLQSNLSGHDLAQTGNRPKSWSPDNITTREIKETIKSSPGFMSLEDLSPKGSLARVLIPFGNGEKYCVSPNQIVHLPGHEHISRTEDTRDNNDVSDNSSYNLSEKIVTAETWDPGENNSEIGENVVSDSTNSEVCDQKLSVVVTENAPVWTSSTVVATQSAVSFSSLSKVPESRSKNTNQSDPFSNQLDHVFDKEEKKQQKISTVKVENDQIEDDKQRECPSRQSSWSSFDSAVLMSFPDKNELSRHSSWGSGDNRIVPSRNSSFGSYDMRPRGTVYYNNEKGEKILHSTSDLENSSSGIFPYDKEDIPWHPGTVKRTKIRIDSGTARQLSTDSVTSSVSPSKTPSSETLSFNLVEAINGTLNERIGAMEVESSAISDNINIPNMENITLRSPSQSRLSISAPESSSMELIPQEGSLSRSISNVSSTVKDVQCLSVKQQRSFIENLHKDVTNFSKKLENALDNANSLGKVQNLKKEFEAKSSTNGPDQLITNTDSAEQTLKVTKHKGSSLPSSPVSVHQCKEQTQKAISDDQSVKTLRSVFENNKEETQVKMRQKFSRANWNNSRHSCFEGSVDKNSHILQTPLISNRNNKQDKNESEYKKPPIVPTVKQIAASVIATAAKKKQQYGNTHPLAKLSIRSRHNNPVYNTM